MDNYVSSYQSGHSLLGEYYVSWLELCLSSCLEVSTGARRMDRGVSGVVCNSFWEMPLICCVCSEHSILLGNSGLICVIY